MENFGDKVRSLGYLKRKGTSNVKPKVNELTGRIGGKEIEHWDDSQDAVIIPDPVRYRIAKEDE
jgi:hypothetical protein